MTQTDPRARGGQLLALLVLLAAAVALVAALTRCTPLLPPIDPAPPPAPPMPVPPGPEPIDPVEACQAAEATLRRLDCRQADGSPWYTTPAGTPFAEACLRAALDRRDWHPELIRCITECSQLHAAYRGQFVCAEAR